MDLPLYLLTFLLTHRISAHGREIHVKSSHISIIRQFVPSFLPSFAGWRRRYRRLELGTILALRLEGGGVWCKGMRGMLYCSADI